MKRTQRGFGLIPVLLAIALFLMLLAMVAQNLVSIMQQRNEDNAKSGILALMTNEATYQANWHAYATGANLHYLNECPLPAGSPPVVTPTATQACLPISKEYTQGGTVYQYNITVAGIIGSDGLPGYLATATPVNNSAGRLTFCANNQDGLLRGKVHGVTPTTAAACNLFPVRDSGTASQSAPTNNPKVYTTTVGFCLQDGNGISSCTDARRTVQTGLDLPAGSYLVTATSVFASPVQGGVFCTLSDSTGTLATGTPLIAVGATTTSAVQVFPFTMQGITTATAHDHVTMTCATDGGTWNARFSFGGAPASTVGPTHFTAELVDSTPQ